MTRKCQVFIICIAFYALFLFLGLLHVQAKSDVVPTSQRPLFWNRECLTCDQSILPGRNASLDIDQQGYPHLISDVTNQITNTYTIMSFYKDNIGWHSQIVDDNLDSGFSLYSKVDSLGYGHILYNDSDLYIKYAYEDQNGWHVQRIFSLTDFGDQLTAQMIHVDSLVIDSSNRPHAGVEAIINQGTTLVYYIYLSETGWQKEKVGEGDHGAVALDSSDKPHYAYVTRVWDGFNVVDRVLSYAYWNASEWHAEEVAHQVGSRVAIALDESGFPHIVSGDYYYPLEYHHKDETGWHRETLGGSIAQNPHILLNNDGKPFIGFNECCGHVAYAFWSPGGWNKGQIPNPYFYAGIGMAMNENEEIHFAFRETSTYNVIYLSPYTGPIYSVYMPIIFR
ncbi:MAG: hypothetical protein ACOY16_12760 [Chloroflexota bacterium]